MTFQNDEGEVLDFDGEFAITKQAVSFFNSKIKGDVSINFNVDNNSVNRKVLGYDGPQMLNQVAFTRQPFILIRNGNPFARGFIVIQNDLGKELDCYFISGNANWLNLVQGLINELDYTGVTNVTDYTTYLNYLTVAVQYATGVKTSGVCFPFIDWAYGGNRGGIGNYFTFVADDKADLEQSFTEFYPCFFLSSLVSEISKQSGLKITGNILNEPLYQRLVITPSSGMMKRDTINSCIINGNPFSTASVTPVRITGFSEVSDPGSNYSSNVYTATRSSRVVVTITVRDASGTAGAGGTVSLRKNGVSVFTFNTSDTGLGEGVYRIWLDGTTGDALSLTPGQTLDIALTATAGTPSVTINVKFEIPTHIISGDYVRPDQFLPPVQCIDIIKFLVSYFGGSIYFNEYSKTISLNLIEKMKEEDALDFSDYYQSHKSGYTIDSAASNYIRLQKSDESPLRGYDSAHFQKYGEANIQTGNTLKENNDLSKIPFAASGFQQGTNDEWQAQVGLVKLVDQEPIEYTSISDSGSPPFGGDAQFNFPAGERYIKRMSVVRIVDEGKGDIGYFICAGGSTTAATFFDLNYWGVTSTGRLYPQAIEYQDIAPRILVVTHPTAHSDFSPGGVMTFIGPEVDVSTGGVTEVTYAYFAKSVTGDTIDSLKANAAPGNPDISTFTDPDVKALYHNKIGRMLGNPSIKAMMLLPESIFQSFDFQSFIELKTKDLTGYFYVEQILNYRDSTTPVEVTLLML